MASCGFRETFAQFCSIQVLGRGNIQPDLLEVRLAEVKKKKKKKKKKKNPRETAVLIEAVYGMIDKRAITSVTRVTSLQFTVLFLVASKE